MKFVPSLPTDNLYKFMALAGFLAFGFGVVYPIVSWQNLELQMVREVGAHFDMYSKKLDSFDGNSKKYADELKKEIEFPLFYNTGTIPDGLKGSIQAFESSQAEILYCLLSSSGTPPFLHIWKRADRL